MSIAVLDAAAAVDILAGQPPGRDARADLHRATDVIAPAHLDAEVFSALARMLRAGELSDIRPHLAQLGLLRVTRFPIVPLLAVAAGFVDRVAAKDAVYVALAFSVDGWLLTTDERLRRAVTGIIPTEPPG